MIAEAIKQRYRRALTMAAKELARENYLALRVIGDIDIVAVDCFGRARLIKLCLDTEPVPKIKRPGNIPVEVWVRKKGEKEFRKIFL